MSRRRLDWLAAYAGWFISFLVRPGGYHAVWGVAVGFWVQLLGLLLWAWAFSKLARSYGVVRWQRPPAWQTTATTAPRQPERATSGSTRLCVRAVPRQSSTAGVWSHQSVEWTVRGGGGSSGYAGWLDERDARLPLTRADRHSQADERAARVVAAGGGMQAVIDATGLRTRANVVKLIDPVILTQALDNDALAQAQAPPPPA